MESGDLIPTFLNSIFIGIKIMKNLLKVNRTEFLQLPNHRKLTIIKSYLGDSNGLTQSELEKFCKNSVNFIEKSVARELHTTVKNLRQRLTCLHDNNFNRQYLNYRNSPNISGRF